jgi:hypothetical protein
MHQRLRGDDVTDEIGIDNVSDGNSCGWSCGFLNESWNGRWNDFSS